jgi:Tfp pilus assembly protein PilN
MRLGFAEFRLMARFNLLPWRAEQRKQQQKDFIVSIGFGMALTSALMLFVHLEINSRIDFQNERNRFLESEIVGLDKKIKEIHFSYQNHDIFDQTNISFLQNILINNFKDIDFDDIIFIFE